MGSDAHDPEEAPAHRIGLVWEVAHKAAGGCCAIASPRGTSRQDSIDTSTCHMGFRCIARS